MVRKRSRTSRKYYDSDENDSDSDFSFDNSPTQPAQKKYSLRQRKRPLFTEDFDYDEDGEEIAPPRAASDDEDFEVEKELELEEAPDTEYVDKTTYINHYEPETDDIPEVDGLVDFEDMIRADIVVNKNRIDYDNLIQKTEIKVQPIEEVKPVKSKRGRKPKVRPEGEVDSSILEPETEVQEEFEDKNDKDYNPDDDLDHESLDCAKLLKTELKEKTTVIENLQRSEEIALNSTNLQEEHLKKGDINTDTIQEEIKPLEDLPEKISIPQNNNEDYVIKTNKNVSTDGIQLNGKVVQSSSEESEKQIETSQQEAVDNDDDDVVLVEDEKKCEVIVLDD